MHDVRGRFIGIMVKTEREHVRLGLKEKLRRGSIWQGREERAEHGPGYSMEGYVTRRLQSER